MSWESYFVINKGKAEIHTGGNGNGEQDFVNGCLHN